MLRFESELLRGKLVKRPNRFLGVIELGGKNTQCFIPNPGRMNELLIPENPIYVIERSGDHRKTNYDLVLVQHDGVLVSIDSRIPNKVLNEAINRGELSEFHGFFVERKEPPFHDSRFDLLLSNKKVKWWLESKSCTLVNNGVALFPDAPTVRGVRHLRTLVRALQTGRAAITFIIQRNDAIEFRPNTDMDPDFADALRYAIEKGVEAYAYVSEVNFKGVELDKRVPIVL
jgi:sugar fermentation stimulation protein A